MFPKMFNLETERRITSEKYKKPFASEKRRSDGLSVPVSQFLCILASAIVLFEVLFFFPFLSRNVAAVVPYCGSQQAQ